MILTMAAVAVTTRKRLERTCPRCGKKQILPPNRINEVVLCPCCETPIPPNKEGLKLVGRQPFRSQSIDFQHRRTRGAGSTRKRSCCGRSVVTLLTVTPNRFLFRAQGYLPQLVRSSPSLVPECSGHILPRSVLQLHNVGLGYEDRHCRPRQPFRCPH